MYGKILAAVNEHLNPEVAARYALNLARSCNAKFYTCFIAGKEIPKAGFNRAEEAMKRLFIKAEEMEVSVESITETGEPVSEIEKVVRQEGIDIVFASTRREDIKRRFYAGTIARSLWKFRLTFHGPRHSLELNYLARFELFNYHGWEGDAVNDERSRFVALNHYEQALTATGTLITDGVSRPIACLGHRDHSWGYRDESKMAGWNWVAVQFPGATINLSQVCVAGKEPMPGGFVSEATCNTRMRTVKIVSTERGEDGIPVASTYKAVDERGRTWTLASRRFSGLVLPLSEAGERVVYENFADFTLAQTGEQGGGWKDTMTHSQSAILRGGVSCRSPSPNCSPNCAPILKGC